MLYNINIYFIKAIREIDKFKIKIIITNPFEPATVTRRHSYQKVRLIKVRREFKAYFDFYFIIFL